MLIAALLKRVSRHANPLTRRRRRNRTRAQALVEFALVLMLIVVTMVGGVLTIQAIFLQQRLIDIVTRAAQWGATTNSNEEINRILDEARGFSRNITITISPLTGRKIGDKLIIDVQAAIPMVGAGIALDANIGARSVVLVEHGPMRFVEPEAEQPRVTIGSYVQIETTAGESLNVRRQPGLRGTPFWSLFKGDTAIVIDGPVILDGLRWWKVERRFRNNTVLSGWCVDKADTVNTLVPLDTIF
jgi:hypothetical protein